ncbi:MAG: J domain-containing protein [Acidobacteria bacterium]|nr:J domain-containing protein [Acidobacteriota bacterium]
MTREEAATVLAVDPDASTVELRSAYRARLREVHPDRGGTARETADVLTAYERLRSADNVDETSFYDVDAGVGQTSTREQHDAAIDVVGDHEEVLMSLHEALEQRGVVTFVDMDSGVLAALIDDVHRLTVTLQARATHVEVFFTLESPGPAGAPVLADLARVLTHGLN